MSWFKNLVGFVEKSPDQVRSNLEVHHDQETGHVWITSKAIDRHIIACGRLEAPSLGELRRRNQPYISKENNKSIQLLQVSQMVADVQSLHQNVQNAKSCFQVASQFNLLEMSNPTKTPEDGIAIYGGDRTQGPACAMACGGATLFRNYLVQTQEYPNTASSPQQQPSSILICLERVTTYCRLTRGFGKERTVLGQTWDR
jgi:hypothetical protein